MEHYLQSLLYYRRDYVSVADMISSGKGAVAPTISFLFIRADWLDLELNHLNGTIPTALGLLTGVGKSTLNVFVSSCRDTLQLTCVFHFYCRIFQC
jgi:hypothetical protein